MLFGKLSEKFQKIFLKIIFKFPQKSGNSVLLHISWMKFRGSQPFQNPRVLQRTTGSLFIILYTQTQFC
jgi:hypothetical protein